MPYQTLSITRSNQREESSAYVLLEQEPWDAYVGMLTKGGLLAYLRSLLYGETDEEQEKGNCGLLNGIAETVVYAYPYPASLAYAIGISHGDLGPREKTVSEYAEVIQVQNVTDPQLKYPTDRIISAEWLSAFKLSGETASRPTISTSGGRIRLSAPCYGSLFVRYEVVRHIYSVTVEPRPDATENLYESFIYATWNGGNEYLKFEPPADAESGGGRCNTGGGESDIQPSDDCEPPSASPADIHQDYDYCRKCLITTAGQTVERGVAVPLVICAGEENEPVL